jgi:hypothetical protein
VVVKTGVAEFQAYFEWLYTNEVTLQDTTISGNDLGLALIPLYLLGDYLDDANFCNAIVDKILFHKYESHAVSFCDESMTLVLENTVAGSPLRALLFTSLASYVAYKDETITSLKTRFSSDTLLEMMSHVMSDDDLKKAMKKALLRKYDLLRTKCAFHRHDEGTPKCPASS